MEPWPSSTCAPCPSPPPRRGGSRSCSAGSCSTAPAWRCRSARRSASNPWDVLHEGLARHLPLSFGLITAVTGVVVLLLWIPLRQRPGVGTVANVVVIAVSVDVALALIPEPAGLPARGRADGRRDRAQRRRVGRLRRRPARPRPARRADDRPGRAHRLVDPAGPHRHRADRARGRLAARRHRRHRHRRSTRWRSARSPRRSCRCSRSATPRGPRAATAGPRRAARPAPARARRPSPRPSRRASLPSTPDQRRHDRADAELDRAEQRGRRARRLAVAGQRQRGRVRQRRGRRRTAPPTAAPGRRPGRRRPVAASTSSAAPATRAERPAPNGSSSRGSKRRSSAALSWVAADQEQRAGAEDAARTAARSSPNSSWKTNELPGDVAEQRRHRQPGHQDQPDERAVAQQAAVGRAGVPRTPSGRRRSAGSVSGRARAATATSMQPEHGQHDEHAAPGGEAQHLAAEGRREHRGHAHHQHQPGEQGRRGAPGEQVAHDRHRDHRRGGRADALQHPQPAEHGDVRRHEAQQRRERRARRRRPAAAAGARRCPTAGRPAAGRARGRPACRSA